MATAPIDGAALADGRSLHRIVTPGTLLVWHRRMIASVGAATGDAYCGILRGRRRFGWQRLVDAVSELGLYYPYIHVRDDAWLKAAALYWPRLGRMVPDGYPLEDSPTARTLRDELNFFVDVEPDPFTGAVSHSFLRFVKEHKSTLSRLYAINRCPHPSLVWIHGTKIASSLIRELKILGLGRRDYSGGSLMVDLHPKLAWVYMAALADRVADTARANLD